MPEEPPCPPRPQGSLPDGEDSSAGNPGTSDDSTTAKERDLLSNILEGLPGIFYLCNRDGRFLRWNKRFEEVSGFAAEQMRAARPMDFFDSNERPALEREIRKVFKSGFAEIEANLLTKSRELIPYYFNGTLIEIEGEPCLMGMGLDITARVRAEAERDASERRTRLAMEAARMGVWETDIETGTQTWDEQYWHLFGCPEPRPATTEEFFRLVHPDDHEHLYRAFGKSLSDSCDYEAEYRIVWPDGQTRWHRVLGHPIFDDGTPVRMLGVGYDITEQKRSEDALRSSEQQLATALEAGRMGTWIWDLGTNTSVFNRQEFELIGLEPSRDPVSSDLFFERVHPDDRQPLAARIERSVSSGTTFDHEFRVILPGGEVRWLAGRGKAVSSGSGPGRMFGVNYDITERRRLEQQLRESQKMEAFGQLAAGVAHDFNNLLTVISGYSDILLMRLSQDDPKRQSVESIADAGKRAAALTRQLLAFTRLSVLEPRIVDLSAVVEDTEKMLRRLINVNIDLTTALAGDLKAVRVDSGQIGQVLLNLVFNARDAMPRGGKLTIETRNIRIGAEHATEHLGMHPGDYVLLRVSDTGIGIDPEHITRIFEPFFTTKRVGEGTGLGLAVVHGIVKQSGGAIEVLSEPGRGTTVNLYLPAAGEHGLIQDQHSNAESLGGTETILLVEDEDAVRRLTAAALRERGYTILEAADGAAAIYIAQNRRGPIDLLLTDIGMPGMDGWQLAKSLTEQCSQLKVLFVSGCTDDAVVRYPVLHEQVAFLQKPYSLDSLAEKVRAVLTEGGYRSHQ